MTKARIGEEFQNLTKYDRDAMEPHHLDHGAQPSVYKEYPEAPAVELPAPSFGKAVDFSELVTKRRSVRNFSARPLTLEQLSGLLWASAGVTRRTPGWDFRAAPSAGALYPIETYLVAGGVNDLEPGVHHYNVHDHALELLKKGDLRGEAARALLDQEFAARAPVIFIWTAVFERSVWKYRQRAYRYVYLDCAHVAGQLSLAAVALGLGSCNIAALYDGEANGLLGVDGVRESTLYGCAVGHPRSQDLQEGD